MRIHQLTVWTLAALLAAAFPAAAEAPAERPVMKAAYAQTPVQVDGKLDDAVWRKAEAYPLHLGSDEDPTGADAVQEPGTARLAWNEDYLYIAVDYRDSDVAAEGEKDQEMHFTMGDVGEVFIRHEDNTVYWELYVTPTGHKSAFFFPGWGRSLPSSFTYEMDLVVGARVEGTLNDWHDTDAGWTGEMAIPKRELERHGDTFPAEGWTILVARYNYGRYIDRLGPELTMTPRLPRTSFHLLSNYARLELQRPGD